MRSLQHPLSGPPLVLLHGGGDRWQHFLPIIPSLAMRWHVFALDLRRLTCPVLLLQGDPSRGGAVLDEDVEPVLEMLTDGVHVRLEGKGHNLGLSSWDVTPLLRAVTSFLESL